MFEVTTIWRGKLRSHRAASWAEACEWTACYPTPCRVWTLAGKLVAMRGAA